MRKSKEDTGNTRVSRNPTSCIARRGSDNHFEGTWVPLQDGRYLAERNGVLDKLRPIFDYVPGDISPPQAPKHTTNSNKPKIPKAPNVKKIPSMCLIPTMLQSSADEQNPKRTPITPSTATITTMISTARN
jgi:hypothetical protein